MSKVTNMEASIVALLVGISIDHGIAKERMLYLMQPKKLGRIYDFIAAKGVI